MKRTLIIVAIVGLAGLTLCGMSVVHAMDRKSRVATMADPNVVSLRHLRAELAATKLAIDYAHPHNTQVASIIGKVLSKADSRIGFEFQVFPSSSQATVARLGRLHARDFDWPKERLGVELEPKVRGVLGNVAFAEYEWRNLWDRRHYTRKAALRSQLVTQHATRALDDALFNSFPPEDPYANALSTTP